MTTSEWLSLKEVVSKVAMNVFNGKYEISLLDNYIFQGLDGNMYRSMHFMFSSEDDIQDSSLDSFEDELSAIADLIPVIHRKDDICISDNKPYNNELIFGTL